MKLLSYLAFLSLVINVALVVIALVKDPRSHLNRFFALVAICVCFWSLGYIFVYGSNDLEQIWFWYRVSSIGWIIVPFGLFYYTVELIRSYKLKHPLLYIAFLIPTVYLLYQSMTGVVIAKDFVLHPIGNLEIQAFKDPDFYIYSILTFGSVIFALALYIHRYRSTQSNRLKKQMIPVAVGLFSMFGISAVFNFFPNLFGWKVPAIGVLLGTVNMMMILYSILRYRFLLVDYNLLDEQVINHIEDMILLVDREGYIKKTNATADKKFALMKLSEDRSRLFNLFIEDDKLQKLFLQVIDARERVDSISLTVKLDGYAGSDLFCSLSPVIDEFDDLVGIIFIGHEADLIETARVNYGITDREKDILIQLLKGQDYKQISEKLFVSVGTVKTHIHNIYTKTGAVNRMDLFRLFSET